MMGKDLIKVSKSGWNYVKGKWDVEVAILVCNIILTEYYDSKNQDTFDVPPSFVGSKWIKAGSHLIDYCLIRTVLVETCL